MILRSIYNIFNTLQNKNFELPLKTLPELSATCTLIVYTFHTIQWPPDFVVCHVARKRELGHGTRKEINIWVSARRSHRIKRSKPEGHLEFFNLLS